MTGYNMPPGVSPRDIPGSDEQDSYHPTAEFINTKLLELAQEILDCTYNNDLVVIAEHLEDLAFDFAVKVHSIEDSLVHNTYPHMCQDAHVEVGFKSDECPLCKALCDLEESRAETRNAIRGVL